MKSISRRKFSKLDDVPMIMEHIKREEYVLTTSQIKMVGKEQGLTFH